MTAKDFFFLLKEITLVSILAISPVTLGDSGVYTCQSGTMSDSGAVANVTVIVTSGKQNKLTSMNNTRSIMSNFIKQFLFRTFSPFK